MILLIRTDGRAEHAARWFRRMRPGESVALHVDGPRGPIRTFRRYEYGTRAVLVEEGATQGAVMGALQTTKEERRCSPMHSTI